MWEKKESEENERRKEKKRRMRKRNVWEVQYNHLLLPLFFLLLSVFRSPSLLSLSFSGADSERETKREEWQKKGEKRGCPKEGGERKRETKIHLSLSRLPQDKRVNKERMEGREKRRMKAKNENKGQ